MTSTTQNRWSGPRLAALLLVLLGLIGLFAGSPYQGTTFTVDAQSLARIVQTETDHVDAETLADWILQGKNDFRLLDVRANSNFTEYHIPGAENVPLTELLQHGLQKNETILLYSDGGIHSAQGWFLLKAKGYRGVYILRGGLEEWKDRVLFPELAANPTPAQTVEFAKMKEVSRFFGGAPRRESAGTTDLPAVVMPKPQLPQTATALPAGPKKKKKEGC